MRVSDEGEVLSPINQVMVSKELGRMPCQNEIGDVDTCLMLFEGSDTFDAIGNIELTAHKAGDGFCLNCPETVAPRIRYSVYDPPG